MPTATNSNTTPTRRSALGFSAAALAAGLTVPALDATSSPDAELIRLCDRLVNLRTYEQATLDLDDYDEADLLESDREWDQLRNRVGEIDRPLTLAGASAMARCVVRHSYKCADGCVIMLDIAQSMGIRISEFLAGGGQ
jgi:hypothetical protein